MPSTHIIGAGAPTTISVTPGAAIRISNSGPSTVTATYRDATAVQSAAIQQAGSTVIVAADGKITLSVTESSASVTVSSQAAGPKKISDSLPVPIEGVFFAGATIENAWTPVLMGGQGHTRGIVRCKRGQGDALLLLAIVPHGSGTPASPDPEDDERYSTGSGETYPFAEYINDLVDVYGRAADGSAGLKFLAQGFE